MAKKKLFAYSSSRLTAEQYRNKIQSVWLNKIFNLYMNKFDFGNVTKEQNYYLKKKFWSDGKIWAFILEGTKPNALTGLPTTENPNGTICFCPFAPYIFNIYDFPIKVNLINTRGATFIPQAPQEVNVDGVIGWAQRNHKPIAYVVEYYIDKITEIEMIIRTQGNAHKMPFVFATTPENRAKVKALVEDILADEESLYVDIAEDIKQLDLKINVTPFILDKLYTLKQAYENELLTYLGLNNVGVMEKKEHLVVDEINANNQVIENSGDCIFDSLKEFCNSVKEVLGYPLEINVKEQEQIEMEDEDNENMQD